MENQEQVINIGDLVYTESENTPNYLTKGKEYEVIDVLNPFGISIFKIKDDENDDVYAPLIGCCHLQNDNWIIKKP